MTPTIVSLPLNDAAITCDSVQYSQSRYERYQNPLILAVSAISQTIRTINQAAGGAAMAFIYPRYSWRINGVERASYTRVGTEMRGAFVGSLGDELDGLYRFDLYGIDAAGADTLLIQHWGYINRTGAAKDCPQVAIQNGSRAWESLATMNPPWPVVYQYAIVDKALLATRRLKPLAPRLGVAFNTPLTGDKLTRINYSMPLGDGLVHTASVTKSGVTVTENRQDYFFSDLTAKVPRLPLFDGDRGFCTTPMTTDMLWGRNGKLYGANPWQAWVMDATGHKRTLYGIRHKYAPLWTEASLDGPEVERVGDWDASIPVIERHAWESWGAGWDARTLAPIDDAAPVPPGETEHPHTGAGPVHFRSDRHGYVLRVQFDGHSHATPAKVSRFFPAADPWGLVCEAGVIYVCERGRDAIGKYDAATATHLGDLIANPNPLALGAVSVDRVWRGQPVAATRAQNIVGPEGLVVQDGYIYWGSLAQQEVRRMPIAGGPIEVVCRPRIDGNSNFIYLGISDGSFGPRGTIFTTTWSITNFGRPQAFLPGAGVDKSDGTALTHATQWLWQRLASNIIQGRGPGWSSDGYGTALAVGRTPGGHAGDPAFGAFATSSSSGDVSVYIQADDTLDGPAMNATQYAAHCARMAKGGDYWRANFQILHGANCAGFDLPLPWGANPDCDYFMAYLGYVNGEDPAVIAQLQAQIATLTAQMATLQAALAKAQATLTAIRAALA